MALTTTETATPTSTDLPTFLRETLTSPLKGVLVWSLFQEPASNDHQPEAPSHAPQPRPAPANYSLPDCAAICIPDLAPNSLDEIRRFLAEKVVQGPKGPLRLSWMADEELAIASDSSPQSVLQVRLFRTYETYAQRIVRDTHLCNVADEIYRFFIPGAWINLLDRWFDPSGEALDSAKRAIEVQSGDTTLFKVSIPCAKGATMESFNALGQAASKAGLLLEFHQVAVISGDAQPSGNCLTLSGKVGPDTPGQGRVEVIRALSRFANNEFLAALILSSRPLGINLSSGTGEGDISGGSLLN